jgi:hypothetical protein
MASPEHSIWELAGDQVPAGLPVLTAGCILDPEAMAALDDRGAAMLAVPCALPPDLTHGRATVEARLPPLTSSASASA